jgi:hypothetical protein
LNTSAGNWRPQPGVTVHAIARIVPGLLSVLVASLVTVDQSPGIVSGRYFARNNPHLPQHAPGLCDPVPPSVYNPNSIIHKTCPDPVVSQENSPEKRPANCIVTDLEQGRRVKSLERRLRLYFAWAADNFWLLSFCLVAVS